MNSEKWVSSKLPSLYLIPDAATIMIIIGTLIKWIFAPSRNQPLNLVAIFSSKQLRYLCELLWMEL